MKDPLTGDEVPIERMTEHMRIQLLDPRWREEQRKLAARRGEDDRGDRAGGEEIAQSLASFAAKRNDIFGSTEAEEAEILEAKQKDEPSNSGGIIWDGHGGSINRVQARVLDILNEQNAGQGTLQQSTGSAAPTVPGYAPPLAGAPPGMRAAQPMDTSAPPPPPPPTATTSADGRRVPPHRRAAAAERAAAAAASTAAAAHGTGAVGGMLVHGAAAAAARAAARRRRRRRRPKRRNRSGRASTGTGLMSAADFAESGANRTVTVRVSAPSTTERPGLYWARSAVEVDCDCTIKEVKSRLKAQWDAREQAAAQHSGWVLKMARRRTSTSRRDAAGLVVRARGRRWGLGCPKAWLSRLLRRARARLLTLRRRRSESSSVVWSAERHHEASVSRLFWTSAA